MNIGILTKPAYNAVSHYRLAPWIVLGKYSDAQTVLINPKTVTEYDLRLIHVLIAHSPSTKMEYNILTLAKSYGVRIVIDYDDLLQAIPGINPAAEYWGKEETQDIATELITHAHVVTVSTDQLASEFLSRFGVEARVINNALDDSAFAVSPKRTYDETKPIKVLWRGSNTHEGDLYTHRQAFREYPNVEFHFFGYRPEKLTSKYGGNLETINYIPGEKLVSDYMIRLLTLAPDIVIVPLEDSAFNRCKSNIAWIEATWAGSICLAPAYMPEFNRPGIMNYEDVTDLVTQLEYVSTSAIRPHESGLLEASRQDIRTNFLLSKVNEARAAALQTLF